MLADKKSEFYEKYLGIPMRRQLNEHELLGKGFYRKWTDVHGRRREIYGIIKKGWKSLKGEEDELTFTVEYERCLRTLIQDISGCMGKMPAFDDNVSAEAAWGGHLAWIREQQKIDPSKEIPRDLPFHYNWIVPDTRVKEIRDVAVSTQATPPVLKMIVAPGFMLEFEAKKSSIPTSWPWVVGYMFSCFYFP